MLPIVDKEREFKFMDANSKDYTNTFIAVVFFGFFIFLFFRHQRRYSE